MNFKSFMLNAGLKLPLHRELSDLAKIQFRVVNKLYIQKFVLIYFPN